MMVGFPTKAPAAVALFDGIPGVHGIVQAALDGMGQVLADSPVHPRSALAWAGDFLCCGGIPGPEAARLLRTALQTHRGYWVVYAPGPWREALAKVGKFRIERRCAFDPAVQPEDGHLRSLLRHMPEGLRFQPIEGEWITRCREAEWSRDFVSLYDDASYEQRGLGVLLMAGNEPVCGASSYVSYPGGIEVQLQTRDDMQGRGYATLTAARLILTAHEHGMIATWDAANPASAHIAEKLGYRAEGLYEVAELQFG